MAAADSFHEERNRRIVLQVNRGSVELEHRPPGVFRVPLQSVRRPVLRPAHFDEHTGRMHIRTGIPYAVQIHEFQGVRRLHGRMDRVAVRPQEERPRMIVRRRPLQSGRHDNPVGVRPVFPGRCSGREIVEFPGGFRWQWGRFCNLAFRCGRFCRRNRVRKRRTAFRRDRIPGRRLALRRDRFSQRRPLRFWCRRRRFCRRRDRIRTRLFRLRRHRRTRLWRFSPGGRRGCLRPVSLINRRCRLFLFRRSRRCRFAGGRGLFGCLGLYGRCFRRSHRRRVFLRFGGRRLFFQNRFQSGGFMGRFVHAVRESRGGLQGEPVLVRVRDGRGRVQLDGGVARRDLHVPSGGGFRDFNAFPSADRAVCESRTERDCDAQAFMPGAGRVDRHSPCNSFGGLAQFGDDRSSAVVRRPAPGGGPGENRHGQLQDQQRTKQSRKPPQLRHNPSSSPTTQSMHRPKRTYRPSWCISIYMRAIEDK